MTEPTLYTAAEAALEKLIALSNRNALGDMEYLWTTIRDLRSALATQPQAPQGGVTDGMKLVPTWPTEVMLLAGGTSIIEGQDNRPSTSWAEEAGLAYRAMLAVAPTETPKGQL